MRKRVKIWIKRVVFALIEKNASFWTLCYSHLQDVKNQERKPPAMYQPMTGNRKYIKAIHTEQRQDTLTFPNQENRLTFIANFQLQQFPIV